MKEVYLICRDIRGVRYVLCYDKSKSEAAWIVPELMEELGSRFGYVAYNERAIAEDRAKRFCNNTYVVPINI